ncbi:MAG: HAMP domain-containing histidine kinase [Ruminococcus sp.]|nr:HAMP domain-containing histidine kinase [Ruminococcus sp.]
MKKRLIYESRIMLIKIMSIFLLVSVLVSFLYIYVTYNGEKEILLDDCHNHFVSFLNESFVYTSYDENDMYFCLDLDNMKYSVNNFQNQSNKNTNYQAVVFDKSDQMLYGTENCYISDFSWDYYYYGKNLGSKLQSKAVIFYDDFISSLNSYQIDQIKDYLSRQTNADGSYYELICKEFYYGDEPKITEETNNGITCTNVEYFWFYRIIPSKLEIVRTKSDHDWYAQDEVVDEFDIELDDEFKNTHHFVGKQTDTKRNVIDEDFIFNSYQDDLYSELCQKFGDDWIDNKGDLANTIGNTTGYYQISPFEYIYCGYENTMGAYKKDDSKKNTAADTQLVKIRYLEKINVLESCINRIGMTFIYTFILMLFVGLVVWFISWNTLKKQLELEKKRRDFTNSMAHDLKTPLFVISGNAENMLLCATNENEKYYAQNVVDKVNSVNDMVHDMLELSALESDKIRVYTEHFNLSDLVQSLVDNYISMMDLCDIHFECAEGVMIDADKTMLRRAMQNLIDNALKYTNDKRSVSIRLDNHSFSISNSVPDNAKINLKSIWEPYYRNENTARKEGNGLGLTVVKSVFELNDLKYGVKFKNNIITFWYSF